MTQTRQILLAERPKGAPSLETTFATRSVELPAPAEGEVLLRLKWLSVDPYMRGRMNDAKSYVAPFELGAPLDGGALAEVVSSASPLLQAGDVVLGSLPWADYALAPAKRLAKIDPTAAPLSAWLGVLGMPGMTAWTGLEKILGGKSGETIVVSAATGAVGSLVCQLAKARGMRVIGVAGGAAKCARAVADYGADVCLDHRAAADAADLARQIGEAAPDGVDCYFENVGGTTLSAVLRQMNTFGRVALCGAIAWYNDHSTSPALAPVWMTILQKRLRVQGFIVSDHAAERPNFLAEVLPLVAGGKINWQESVTEGLENAPAAFIGLLNGANEGKQLVKLD